jgi:hypothetical protein
MPKVTEDFPLDIPLDAAASACRSAIAGLGWRFSSSEPQQIEAAIPGGAGSWPSKIAISLAATTPAHTVVTLDGRIGGAGPIQKRHLGRCVNRLRDEILVNADGICLSDCTLLGGYGHDIAPGTRCSAMFSASEVHVDAPGYESVVFAYEDIDAVEVGGRGLVEAKGGFIGGGFGAQSALVGIGIATVLNSLTSRSRTETLVNIKGRDRQAWLYYTREPPQALQIRLAGVLARIESAQPGEPGMPTPGVGSVSVELARLHELHSRGVLTADEYGAAKARLIELI